MQQHDGFKDGAHTVELFLKGKAVALLKDLDRENIMKYFEQQSGCNFYVQKYNSMASVIYLSREFWVLGSYTFNLSLVVSGQQYKIPFSCLEEFEVDVAYCEELLNENT